MSQPAANTQGVRAERSAAWSPPGAPFPGRASGTTGTPRSAYGAGSFATTSTSPKSARKRATARAASVSPPARSSPFGHPPSRVAFPPATSAPVHPGIRSTGGG